MAGWKRADLTALSGAPPAQGRPFVYVTEDGSRPIPRVLYTGQDSRIHGLRLEGGSWKKADLTDLGGAPPAACDPVGYVTPAGSGSTPRVVYRDGGARLQELRLE